MTSDSNRETTISVVPVVSDRISINHINPLIQDQVADTMFYVRAVLEVLEELRLADGPSENYDFGLLLIHRWLGDTLRFAEKHPGVGEVTPVIEEGLS